MDRLPPAPRRRRSLLDRLLRRRPAPPRCLGHRAALMSLTGHFPAHLTGDNPRTAAQLTTGVGITDVRAGPLPEDKLDDVAALHPYGHRVLLVGDGVNDAPALAAAVIVGLPPVTLPAAFRCRSVRLGTGDRPSSSDLTACVAGACSTCLILDQFLGWLIL